MRKGDQIIEITRRELGVLREFLKVLKSERDFIISFSLDGLIECNNKKEMLLKKIEFLENERERIMDGLREDEREKVISELKEMREEFVPLLQNIRQEMTKNLNLLSFSADHLKGIVEVILDQMNRGLNYGKKRFDTTDRSLLLTVEV